MPPVAEVKKPAPANSKAAKAKPPATGQHRSPDVQSQMEEKMRAALKAQGTMMPDWAIRAAVISRFEELRARVEMKSDGVTGTDAGHNDIYDAERHARWMYRLTLEVGEWAGEGIGAMKEAWGMLKGAGGAETAMDLHNNEIGRKAALAKQPIPDRHTTAELVYLDEATGKPRTNGERLSLLRAMARGKVSAAAAKGAAAAARLMATSGSAWWHANQAKYPNSARLEDLEPPFRGHAVAFHDALVAAGASVNITSTRRDKVRAYLMHYSWTIANGTDNPANVPGFAGVNIIWDHGDLAASRQAAAAMRDLFGMAHIAALNSNHIRGQAVDMYVTWAGTIDVANADGASVAVGAPGNGVENRALHRIGATYGVHKLVTDKPHWSDDGG